MKAGASDSGVRRSTSYDNMWQRISIVRERVQKMIPFLPHDMQQHKNSICLVDIDFLGAPCNTGRALIDTTSVPLLMPMSMPGQCPCRCHTIALSEEERG